MITRNKNVKFSYSDENFSRLLVSQFALAIYGLIVSILLVALSSYHTAIVNQNETTQEEQRDKYRKWGGNPYNLGSSSNWRYFFRVQDSLIYNTNEKTFNQHVLDSKLIYSVEVEEEDDLKSLRSHKSHKSIKSEVHIISSQNSDNPDRVIEVGAKRSKRASSKQLRTQKHSRKEYVSQREDSDDSSQSDMKSFKSHKSAKSLKVQHGKKQ